MEENTKTSKKSGLATAGMVLGIIAIVLSFIPIINNLAFVLGILALIFGAIALAKKASKGKAVTAVVLGVLSVAITLLLQQVFSDALNDATSPTKASTPTNQSNGDTTEPTAITFDGAAFFDKVTTGMTKDEVRKLAGVDPTSCTESQDPTYGKTEYCSYGNFIKDKVTVDVTYQQDKVSNKTKSTH